MASLLPGMRTAGKSKETITGRPLWTAIKNVTTARSSLVLPPVPHESSLCALESVIQALRRHVSKPAYLMSTTTFIHAQTLDLNSYRVTPLQNAARHEVSNKEGNLEEHPPVSDA